MRLPCALAVLLTASCASSPQPHDKTSVATPPAAEVRLQTCRTTLQADDMHQTVMACRLLWTDVTCQTGWENALQVPRGERPKIVLDACLPAYCAGPETAPICTWPRETVDITADTPDWFAGWEAFNVSVLPAELDGKVEGPEAGAFARHLLMTLTLQR